MKLKIITIDDEADALDVLKSIIETKRDTYEIVAQTTNPIEGVGLILMHKPDVVFLDIEMPGINGFQLLESIPDIDFDVIFVTAYESYAVRAIKENALDYILKPATIDEVLMALEKAELRRQNKGNGISNYKQLIETINANSIQRIRIPTINGFELVEANNLMALQADGAYTTAYFDNGERIVISKSIKLIEPILNPNLFIRVHRSYIINLMHIKRYDREKHTVLLSNNSEIPISRRRYGAFVESLKNIEEKI